MTARPLAKRPARSSAGTTGEKQLPCDALIYLGTEFTPSGWNTRNGEFGWKPENFRDPSG
jgi:alpha-glucosidase/alpha-D-xyloside xylohydrolase